MTGKEVKKGFAGLDSMVSDVAAEPERSAPPNRPQVAENVAAAPAAEPGETRASAAAAGPRSAGPGGYWLVGIAVLVLLGWLINSTKSSTEAPATVPQVTKANPATTAGANASAATRTFETPQGTTSVEQVAVAPRELPPLLAPTPAYADIREVKPSEGVGLVLERSQIRYCLSESIRMDAWQGQLNANPAAPVAAFNAAVGDYNSRCSNFRYRIGVLEAVRSEVEANRAELTQQGYTGAAAAIALAPPAMAPAVPAMKTSFDCAKARSDAERLICSDADLAAADVDLATQFATAKAGVTDLAAFKEQARQNWNLRERNCHDRDCLVLWYKNQRQWLMGIINGQPEASAPHEIGSSSSLSDSERASIESACRYDRDINGPAAYHACVSNKKQALENGPRHIDLISLSPTERSSIESACNYDKSINGPAAYNACLLSKKRALENGPRRIDLTTLSSTERSSIESACNYDKSINGPAAYNQCLSQKLRDLDNAPRQLDLSALNRMDRSSIESACNYDRSINGPAAYYQCLSDKLQQMKQ